MSLPQEDDNLWTNDYKITMEITSAQSYLRPIVPAPNRTRAQSYLRQIVIAPNSLAPNGPEPNSPAPNCPAPNYPAPNCPTTPDERSLINVSCSATIRVRVLEVDLWTPRDLLKKVALILSILMSCVVARKTREFIREN
ncbi:unnamed protein product [Cyprideis torosa]|uniref:Uncharacterized protein n=1 Tax=Cyprideis torosa TaxID=163714 RepID=A0A7R8WGB7_9CRUS|nr:unnamed protein product [Cyprideis torosa]CAG0897969.1 unnamed protein product [Cyprideis torosa]